MTNDVRIRQMTVRDIYYAAKLHRDAIPGISSHIGIAYLNNLYRVLALHPTLHLSFVAEKNQTVIGMITSTYNRNKTKKKINCITLSPYVVFNLLRAILLRKIRPRDVVNRLLYERELTQAIPNLQAAIFTLFVASNSQRAGVGTSLVQKIIQQCKMKGAKELYVETGVNNEKAIAFYKKVGFKTVVKIRDIFVLKISL